MTMRYGEIARKTAETDIALRLELDGTGQSAVQTGVGFLDHMATLFLIFQGTAILFSVAPAPIYVPTNSVGGFSR